MLERIPTGRHTLWAEWLRLHPTTTVLKPEARWVGKPGDTGYFDPRGARSGDPYLPPTFGPTIQTRDERLELHDRVYGIVVGGTARAYPLRRLELARIAEEEVAGVPVTVWWQERSRSFAAFDRRLDGTTHTFTMDEHGVVRDAATKSRWTLDGLCIEGSLRGKRLTPLRGLMAEWYGWYANHPTTTIWQPY